MDTMMETNETLKKEDKHTKVICISGKAGHGKDTFGQYLYEDLISLNKSARIFHFADLVKFICKQYFDWNGEKDEAGRHLLQYIGTDVIRNQNENYWVDFIINLLTMLDGTWDYIVIPDCRFPNEADRFKDSIFKTYVVRVNRPDYVSTLTEEQQRHASETAMDNYDFDKVVFNNSLVDLAFDAALMCNYLINNE